MSINRYKYVTEIEKSQVNYGRLTTKAAGTIKRIRKMGRSGEKEEKKLKRMFAEDGINKESLEETIETSST